MSEADNKYPSNPDRVYQFSAEARNQAGSFEPLRDAILDWVHENVVRLSPEERRVAHLTLSDHDFGIAQYETPRQRSFAIRYARGRAGLSRDPQDNAALKVRTEIVLRAGERDLDIYISKSHFKRMYARLTAQDQRTRPPSILAALAGHIKVEESGWPLIPAPLEMNADSDFRSLGSFILAPNRLRPIILALGSEEGATPQWDKGSLNTLAKNTYGFAHVIYVPFELIDRFHHNVGRNWQHRAGQVRQFNPGFLPTDVLTQHPILAAMSRRPAEREEQLAQHTHELLSVNFSRRSAETILNFDSVYGPIVERELRRSEDDANRDPHQANALLRARLELAERDAAEYRQIASELLEVNEQQETEIRDLKNRTSEPDTSNVRKTHERRMQWKAASIEFGIPIPGSIRHVGDWAAEYFPDSLILCRSFLNECQGMENYSPTRTQNFYKILTIMGIHYGVHHSADLRDRRELYFKNKPLGDVLEEFGFSARQVTTATLREYRTAYQAQDPQGTRWNLDWHVRDRSTSDDPTNMLRIYYAPGPRAGFAVIGKGPRHLPIFAR